VEVLKISGTAFVGGTLLCDHRTPIALASTGYLKVQVTGTVVLGLARRAEKLLSGDHGQDTLLGAIGQQAVALKGLGRLTKAEKRYKARRDLAWKIGELSYYARTLRDLAQIKRERPEERDEARGMYDEAAEVFLDLREYYNYRSALNGKGALEVDGGSLEAAEELFTRSRDSADDEEHGGDQARARMNIGIVYQNRETWQWYEAAEANYREVVPQATDWDEPELLGDVLFNLAQLLFYLMSRHQDARAEAVSAACAYGRAGSPKESWARDLVSEIDNAVV
jgi:tetratricopeptide (TPR) repeat protein